MRNLFHLLQAEHPWILRAYFFGFGACVGSFLNVCILRLPAGKSIVTPRSHCVCGKPIAWYDNIPILSWFILGGKARCCGARFSIRYAIIEAVTACVFLWLWLKLPPGPALAGMLFFSLLLLGGMIDLDHMILPDISTIGGMFLGVLVACVWPQIQHVTPTGDIWLVGSVRAGVMSLIGILVGTGVIFWIRELGELFLKKEAVGYGDVLLMGCIGAFCGWQGAVFAIFGGAVIALAFLAPWMLVAKLSGKATKATEGAKATTAMDATKAIMATEGKKTEAEIETPNPKLETGTEGHPTPEFGVAIPFGPWLALAGFLFYAFLPLQNFVMDYFAQIHALIFLTPNFPQ